MPAAKRTPRWPSDRSAKAAGKWSGKPGRAPVAGRHTQTPAARLPSGYEELVRLMPPQAIADDARRDLAVAMIDRLMAAGKRTSAQRLYLETLVQLVGVYESHALTMETSDLGGLDSLRHLMLEHGMIASGLARLLGVHASMGSKILHGDRSLTVDHLKRLSERFKVGPECFID